MKGKTFSFELLGSKFYISFFNILNSKQEEELTECVNECYSECLQFDDDYSRFKQSNVLSLINDGIGEIQEVDDELFYLFSKAREVEKNTNGAFSIHTKELLEKWGYDANYNFLKSKDLFDEKNSKIKSINTIKPFELDSKNQSIIIYAPIEFGGLGKGFILDKLVEICKLHSDNFLINAGGDLYAQTKELSDTVIKLEHPLDTKKHIGGIKINKQAIASSSSNRRQWENYHHIINPKLNEPANNMLSTHVLMDKGIDADSYATALFALGFEEAKKIALKNKKIQCLLISKELEIWMTKDFKCQLDEKYNDFKLHK